MQNIDDYFIVNKQIIKHNENIVFDLYCYDADTRNFFIVYEKGMNLSPYNAKTLSSYDKVYAQITNETFYNEFYQGEIEEKLIPKDMKSFYEGMTDKIEYLFANLESLETVKNTQEIVSGMIDLIVKDDFVVATFVTILTSVYHTYTHSLNVSVYALCLGKHIGLKKSDLLNLGTAALLHDIGKSKINNNIINKNGKLTTKEFTEVKKHPYYGFVMAKKIGITNQDILTGIHLHHEKIDGSGYPKGLKKDAIPLFARIISICDAFDAISTRKSYKDSMGTFDTLIMMKKEMSNSFDSRIINGFIQMLKG